MNKQIAILAPRLDCMFKEGPVPDTKGPISPIRKHWHNFVISLAKHHIAAGDWIDIIEKPLWQFTPEFVNSLGADIVYIPHKEPRNFPYLGPGKAKYYMQTVFPQFFTIDPNGWGANLSTLPFPTSKTHLGKPAAQRILGWFEIFAERIKTNTSKFDQPALEENAEKDYILFVCQIPHDEVILYHSKVSVAEALKATLDFAAGDNIQVIVKGHPVNPGSMSELIEITKASKTGKFVTHNSIHAWLKNCTAAFMVNSGVGFETLLHKKDLFHFGRAEYAQVACKIEPNIEDIRAKWNKAVFDHFQYADFTMQFINHAYNSRDVEDFKKLS